MSSSEVKIFTTFDYFEADQVIALLESNGIPSVRRTSGSSQYVGFIIGYSTIHEINVCVPEEAAEKAVDILTETGFLKKAKETEEKTEEDSSVFDWEIMPCTSDHLERYAEIYAKAFAGEPWHDPWNAEDAAIHLWEVMEMRRAYGLEYRIGGEVVGLVMGSSKLFHYGRSFEISDLAVDPAYQRQGIAQKLLERLLADLKEQDIVDVNLITAREGDLSKLYEKFGFREADVVMLMGRKI